MTQRRSNKRKVDGVLLLDKPYGISSNQALQKARWLLSAEKGGHTGVLDPLATGLLPLCFGEATKFAQRMLDADKRYVTTMKLGVRTTTGDIEGEPLETRPVTATPADIERAVARFVGPIQQVPPMYSALKHEGRALYDYARQGIEIERAARPVTIYGIDLLGIDGDLVTLDVRCSKGTYIRVLAEDIGELLGCGAHLTALRRTATAGFRLEDALTLEAFEALSVAERDASLLPADALVQDLPLLHLDVAQTDAFTHGMSVLLGREHGIIPLLRLYGQIVSPADGLTHSEFLGLGELTDDGKLQPRRLLSTVVHDTPSASRKQEAC